MPLPPTPNGSSGPSSAPAEGGDGPLVRPPPALAGLLAANEAFARHHVVASDTARPSRRAAILTCMDARIAPLAALGFDLGEAHVLRNAGARVTDDVLRSLALSSHVLGIDTVVVMQHTRCGLDGETNEHLRTLTGAPALDFLPIVDHARALNDDVALLAATPFLDPIHTVIGAIFDVDTGRFHHVVSWERA